MECNSPLKWVKALLGNQKVASLNPSLNPSFQPGLLTLPLYEAVGEPCVKKSNDKRQWFTVNNAIPSTLTQSLPWAS